MKMFKNWPSIFHFMSFCLTENDSHAEGFYLHCILKQIDVGNESSSIDVEAVQ